MQNKIKELLEIFESSQWNHIPNFDYVKNLEIITREDLRNIKMKKHMYKTKTSGSTGEPVGIEKTHLDYIWYMATNIREMRWKNWDFSKNIAFIKPGSKTNNFDSWGIPKNIEPKQGKTYRIGYLPIKELQSWLEEKNPHYLHCPPSIISQLDISRISNLIDHKGTGEPGASMYSSEECGTIAIRCPENPDYYHVMENQIIEADIDGSIIITTTTNPYIKRYKHGDHLELGKCTCKRPLQTIKKIHGRVRNMFVLPNGDKKWPLFGSRDYYEKFGIKRYKVIQTSINNLEIHIISDHLGDKEKDLINLIKKLIDSPIEVSIKYVNEFPNYKFEEFVCMIK